MYEPFNLSKIYFSIPSNIDYTQQITLEILNLAINCCDTWSVFADIGAGNGMYSVPLLSKFKRGIVIDADPSQIDLVMNHLSNKSLEIKEGFIQDVELSTKVDFFMLMDVIEHIPPAEVERAIQNMSKSQHKGGVIFVRTPNAFMCAPAETSSLYYLRHAYGHYKHYTREELVSLFQKYGYQELLHTYESRYLRDTVQRIIFGLHRRKILFLFKPLCKFLSYLIYKFEINNLFNPLGAITQTFTFKKI